MTQRCIASKHCLNADPKSRKNHLQIRFHTNRVLRHPHAIPGSHNRQVLVTLTGRLQRRPPWRRQLHHGVVVEPSEVFVALLPRIKADLKRRLCGFQIMAPWDDASVEIAKDFALEKPAEAGKTRGDYPCGRLDTGPDCDVGAGPWWGWQSASVTFIAFSGWGGLGMSGGSEVSCEEKQESAISILTGVVFWGISQEENETNDTCNTDTAFCALD